MKFTLGRALSISYKLYASPESDIASIAYNTGRNQRQRMRKGSTVGPQQVTISSLTLHSMRFLIIPTEKCHSRYISIRLEPVVKPWIVQGHDFALKKGGDSGHGKAKNNNIVQKWRAENKLKYFFNCASLPDLSPIKNCWQPPK